MGGKVLWGSSRRNEELEHIVDAVVRVWCET